MSSGSSTTYISTDTSAIREWRSILVLIVFVIANLIVLFPFHIWIPIPPWLYNGAQDALASLRIIPWRDPVEKRDDLLRWRGMVIMKFPMNMVTGPLIADLFLLAVTAIGREEVKAGTLGADNIEPIDIMAFFFTLAYIAISIDASGLIRWLAFKVLQKGGGKGQLLYFYLYAFFFVLSCGIGNDPVVLSGTAFLAYMWRVSANIKLPRAWIHAQFAAANMGSAVLVSSNPTNLVLAGAFQVKFIEYSANMIVPVVATAIVLFPFLLWVIFFKQELVPSKIDLHEMPSDYQYSKPVNPNIPNARAEGEEFQNSEEGKQMLIEEIMNPFLDRASAGFGALIMAATLITILAVNASSASGSEHPVYWITLPAAFVMLLWDLSVGWLKRHETREIAARHRADAERRRSIAPPPQQQVIDFATSRTDVKEDDLEQAPPLALTMSPDSIDPDEKMQSTHPPGQETKQDLKEGVPEKEYALQEHVRSSSSSERMEEKTVKRNRGRQNKTSLQSLAIAGYKWFQVTFPTSTVVIMHLPFALIPFAFSMFVLVQGLASKGWVPVFAHGWEHWVRHTGVVGAIGGMAFLSVVLCNFAGTNIGTTILLSRVIQSWVALPGNVVSQRMFWATVYSMAIGVNFGAFSTALSASLAGLLWRDILHRKFIEVRSLDFARINIPIIAIAMIVGCTVLIGEVYIFRGQEQYLPGWVQLAPAPNITGTQ